MPVYWADIKLGFTLLGVYNCPYIEAEIPNDLLGPYELFKNFKITVANLATQHVTTRHILYTKTFISIDKMLSVVDTIKQQKAQRTLENPVIDSKAKQKLESLGFNMRNTPHPDALKALDIPDSIPTFHKSEPLKKSDQELIKAIKVTLELGLEDMTEAISTHLDTSTHVTSPTGSIKQPSIVWGKSEQPVDEVKPSNKLIKDLDWVRRIKTTFSKQTRRGQENGLLDRRRLYRHYTDDLAYKKSSKTQKNVLALVLLLDSSQSMIHHKPIYEAAKALHTIVKNIDILIYSLDTQYKRTKIQNITFDGKFRKVHTEGYTPSAEALAATAIKFPESLLIHFTDGDPNGAFSPATALKQITNKDPKIQIVNILMGSRTRVETIKRHYPDNIPNVSNIIIPNVSKFPDALKVALKPWYRI